MISKSDHNFLNEAKEIALKNDFLLIEPPERHISNYDTIELFALLNNALNQNDPNIEIILVDLLRKIKVLSNSNLTTSHFEPLLFILEKPELYSEQIIENVLNIIYYLITHSLPKSHEYFLFFSQPHFYDSFLSLSACEISKKILTVILHKKHSLYENYQQAFQQIIRESPTTSATIDLLTECIDISDELPEIENISTELDFILKSTDDASIFATSITSIRHLIKKYPISCGFFAENALFYLKETNDDLENLDLIKLFADIVKVFNSYEFLLVNDTFVHFVVSTIQATTTKDLVLSSLAKLLNHQADVSSFIRYPIMINEILKALPVLSYKDRKYFMKFLLNLSISSNIDFVKAICETNFVEQMIAFLDLDTDTSILQKLLMLTGMIFKNKIPISSDLIPEIEKFATHKDREIVALANAVLQNCKEE